MNDSTTWSPTASVLDARPDGGDDTGSLVPAEHRESARGNAARHQVLIGMAQPGGFQVRR